MPSPCDHKHEPKHECTLPRHLRKDPLYNFRVKGVKGLLARVALVSEKHPLTRRYLRSRGAVAFEKRRQVLSGRWYILHPFSKLAAVWQVSFTILSAIASLNIPLAHKTFFMFLTGDFVLFLLQVLCLINVISLFFSGYIDKESYEIVIDHRMIIRNYLTGYFALDLLAAFPIFELWCLFGYPSFNDVSIRILFIGVFHIFQLRIFLKYSETLIAFCRTNQSDYYAFRVISVMIIMLNFLACMQSYVVFLVRGKDVVKHDLPWVQTHSTAGHETPLDLIMPMPNVSSDGGWTFLEGSEPHPIRYYIICLTRTIVLLYSMGFGYSDLETSEDIYVGILYVLLGKVLLFCLMEKALKFRSWVRSPNVKYHMLMKQVNYYMRRKHLPQHLQTKVRVFYEYRLSNRFFEERAILENLSVSLRNEVRFHECRRLLKESVLFRRAPAHVIERLLLLLVNDVFLPNDVVMKAGAQGDCMFFLVSGTVAMVSRMGDEIMHLGDGSYFGELALLSEDERQATTVVAVEICEVYRLGRQEFKQVVRPIRDLYNFILEMARQRLNDLMNAEVRIRRLHAMSMSARLAASKNL